MVDHKELDAIKERMEEVDSRNRIAFFRKMAIDGYATNVDLTPVKELISLQRRCVNNLKQIAKHAEEHGAYQAEITELQKGMPSYGNSIQNSKNTLRNLLCCERMRDFGPMWPEVK